MSIEFGSMMAVPKKRFSPVEYDQVKREMTVEQRGGDKFGFGKGQTLKLYYEQGDNILLPREYGRRFIDGELFEDKTVPGSEVAFKFRKTLRDAQVPLVQEFMENLQNNGYGGVFCAPCGTGKTVSCLAILARLQVTTLVLVHTGFLMKQWRERIGEFLEIPEEDIGVIQQDKCDWFGKSIVLGMIESISSREYDPAMYQHFGCVVSDEVHRLGAPTWRAAIEKFPARIRIGLSATPRRADGLWNVIRWHIGEILTHSSEWEMKPDVYIVSTGTIIPAAFFTRYDDKINLGKLITMLSKTAERNKLIIDELVRAIGSGRKVLLLSDRREHLNVLQKSFKKAWGGRPMVKIGFCVGGMKEKDMEEMESCNLLLGTFQYAKEGLDIPAMDTLFLTMPKGDVEQPCGRVLRSLDGKRKPIVVDFVDKDITVCYQFGMKRLKMYKKLEFPVRDTDKA